MDGYIIEREKLSNEIYEIGYTDIKTLLNVNEEDKVRCAEITRKTNEGAYQPKSIQEFMFDILLDAQREGSTISYPHGTVIRQAERGHYYRGERQIYNKSVSSLYRAIEINNLQSKEQKELYKSIADMRIHQFKSLLSKFRHVREWQEKYGDVLYEPLAQHYGFETTWLDITNDFLVAMFFSTCYEVNGEWKPLTEKQTKNHPYGMIFHIPCWQVSFKNMAAAFPDYMLNNAIWPIGFQPFARCHMQHGYGINMLEESPLQEDIQFEKLKFRHSKKLSEMIFEMCGRGKKIFPEEGLGCINNIITNMRKASIFSYSDLEYAFEKSEKLMAIDAFRQQLLNSNILGKKIQITEQLPNLLTSEQIRLIDEKYKEFSLEKTYGINPGTRLIFYPQSE